MRETFMVVFSLLLSLYKLTYFALSVNSISVVFVKTDQTVILKKNKINIFVHKHSPICFRYYDIKYNGVINKKIVCSIRKSLNISFYSDNC